MGKQPPKEVIEALKECGLGKDSLWDCHGTWVVYHSALEKVAAHKKIIFNPPVVLEANGPDKCVALCVTGHMGSEEHWSIGEAAPQNCKNAYPYAMAEKRGKDRVILKFLGLHGLLYSEEEAEVFKEGAPPKNHGQAHGPLGITELKNKIKALVGDIANCIDQGDLDQFNALISSSQPIIEQCSRDLPGWYTTKEGSDTQGLEDRIANATKKLSKQAA